VGGGWSRIGANRDGKFLLATYMLILVLLLIVYTNYLHPVYVELAYLLASETGSIITKSPPSPSAVLP
jgi:uncharacterized membrane protein YdfJ with MMPL/SSD domain